MVARTPEVERALGQLAAHVGVPGALKMMHAPPFYDATDAGVAGTMAFARAGTDPTQWIQIPSYFIGRSPSGWAYCAGVRRVASELEASEFARALDAASALRNEILAGDTDDRMTMLFVLAYVFSRDGRWAHEVIEDVIETPRLAQQPGAGLLLACLKDPDQIARAVPHVWGLVLPQWTNPWHLYDIVDAMGSEAAMVLEPSATFLEGPMRKTLDDAITLARS